MLLPLLADNHPGLYFDWDGVGLASSLLIGFSSHQPAAPTAAEKALIVNHVGDVALMIMSAQR